MANQEQALSLDDELPVEDLVFFADEGIKKLLRAMLKQSCKDIITDRKDAHAPADVSASARWPATASGRNCIEFLIPGATSDKIIAKLYESPADMFAAIERTETSDDDWAQKNRALRSGVVLSDLDVSLDEVDESASQAPGVGSWG